MNREKLPNVETGIEAEKAWPFTHADIQRARGHWIINLTGLLPFGHARPQCGSIKTRQDKTYIYSMQPFPSQKVMIACCDYNVPSVYNLEFRQYDYYA